VNVQLLACAPGEGGVDLRDLLAKLATRGIAHLLVEGGAHLAGRLLAEGLVDRVAVLVAPKIVGGDGVPLAAGRGVARMSDALTLGDVRVERLGDDVLVTGIPARSLAKRGGRG
jgi:diaminohydroxyphosphoribosylaminopyrimidine deaminase/5-amino-6-(5-phosphoribosylamino)uracil reductase